MSRTRKQFGWAALTCATLSVFALAVVAQRHPKGEQAQGLAEDKGRLIITVNGQVAATEDFSIERSGNDWVARGTTQMTGSATKVTGDLRLNSAGEPLRYTWSSEGAKKMSSVTTFDDRKAQITVNAEDGKSLHQDFQFSAPVVILDNNLYHQYEILARIYNWSLGGTQSFGVLIPQEISPGTVTVDAPGPATVDGARYERLVMHTPDVDITLYLDATHRLMRLNVPSANAEIRRQ
jgi:hypothetical protein